MSARATMKQRAVIERDVAVGESDWGGEPEPDWRIHLDDLPCRIWFKAGKEVVDGTKTAVVEDRRMIVPVRTDVDEGDRIARVNDRRGRLIFDGPMRIESVGSRSDHLELMLEAI